MSEITSVELNETVTAGAVESVVIDYVETASGTDIGHPDFCTSGAFLGGGRETAFIVQINQQEVGREEICMDTPSVGDGNATVEVDYTAPTDRGEYQLNIIVERANSGGFQDSLTTSLFVREPGDECLFDDECAGVCVDGQCVDCRSDTDCPPGEVCVSGVCREGTTDPEPTPEPEPDEGLPLALLAGGALVAVLVLRDGDDRRQVPQVGKDTP